ncbi:MAG: glycoside hydrolase family 99-like domain-containing protein [Lachnospiraceae bacterium]|nr:glycoside hydrolase family 99-like domain-containing protein [Lachnospiraceae bacterium]
MKTIAMYLPQYHNVEENNAWWGEGYTDWKAMEMAKPLYEGHIQPKEPLDHRQYDLEKKETLQWQAELMNKYGLYGVAIYHYWFKDGRKILERPAENLLKWSDIKIPFCFYWANESWVRSWSAVENQNIWAANFEQERLPNENENGVLLEQDYGRKDEWVKHFEYFVPFFKDERYIKIDGKPVIMIYRPASIMCLKEMIDCWRECAREKGFSGVFLIGANCNNDCKEIFDMQLLQEPGTTIDRDFPERYTNKNRMEVARYLAYDEVWRSLLNHKENDSHSFFGGFSNYDDTPRRGNAGTVIFNGSAEKFKIYLTELYAKNAAAGNEYVFINAWNEWGEGMYMEPDETEQYGYLEAIAYAERHYKNEIYKYTGENRIEHSKDELQIVMKQKERFCLECQILSKWLGCTEKGVKISEYFIAHNYKNIAIYGYGMLGKHLLSELKNSDVIVKAIIDLNADGLKLEIPVKKPSDNLEGYDLIVVTNVHIYKEICKSLKKHYDGKVVSLETVINEVNE